MNLEPLKRAVAQLEEHAPSFNVSPEREAAFSAIAHFLENNIRSGQPFDLKTVQPNPLWQWFEDKLNDALTRLRDARPAQGQLRIHQWYSSGVIVDDGQSLLGFDVIPMRRLYGWEDRYNMTERLAATLDALFVTHRHEDHYDVDLVRACLKAGVPVFLPEAVARSWPSTPGLHAAGHDHQWEVAGVRIHAREGIHVWRDDAASLPLVVFEAAWPSGACIVYGGDVDYTHPMPVSEGVDVAAFFLPWRAPNARYEPGDARQIAPLHVAVEQALGQLKPHAMFYQHCAELEHVYDGFTASFDMALDLKNRLPVSSELMFWGEWMDISLRSNRKDL